MIKEENILPINLVKTKQKQEHNINMLFVDRHHEKPGCYACCGLDLLQELKTLGSKPSNFRPIVPTCLKKTWRISSIQSSLKTEFVWHCGARMAVLLHVEAALFPRVGVEKSLAEQCPANCRGNNQPLEGWTGFGGLMQQPLQQPPHAHCHSNIFKHRLPSSLMSPSVRPCLFWKFEFGNK